MVDDMKRHNEHTMECLLYWELIMGSGSDPALRRQIAETRIAIAAFVSKRERETPELLRALGMA